MSILKVNDTVSWKANYGKEPAKEAKIEAITITSPAGGFRDVQEIEWDKMVGRDVIVTLDNGSWAYAEQIDKIETKCQ